jgi:hypothetical protein
MSAFPVIAESDLPVPRLELRWGEWDGRVSLCDYNLVFELGPYDCRHKRRDEMTGGCAEKRVRLGRTKVESGQDPGRIYKDESGTEVAINTPFRDSSHIAWDGHQLGLRAFVVAKGRAQELATRPNERAIAKAQP